MSTNPPPPTRAELADEASAWIVGGGTLTLALFPLALPALVLLAVGLIPLLIPLLGLGVLVAVLAVPFLLVRAVLRRALRARRPRHTTGSRGPRPEAARSL
jgi:membrane protein implicated in regulation of membrane protease activity